ncbi:hypothetical protein PVAP13_3NG217802 [Panicum virgatum]|uniref:Uncharacterized protein n=1 Tax=Panicum virgatum TaxID=38727 RepID=A0A8T0UJ76_PANVG|nr:hypothetical protein PVAP13_3NG217802 [Panicum virgatum]
MNPPDPDESPSLPRGVAPPSSPSQPPLPSLLRRHLLHCQRQELEARAEVVGQPRELHARAEVACRCGSSMRGKAQELHAAGQQRGSTRGRRRPAGAEAHRLPRCALVYAVVSFLSLILPANAIYFNSI